MVPLIVVLRILHIVFSLFWVGIVFYMILILMPRLRALGPTIQNPLMKALTPVQTRYILVSAIVTVLSGVALTLIMRWGSLGMLFSTGWGWSMVIGFITTLVAAILGFGVVIPTGRRMEAIGSSIKERPPKPEEAQQLQKLGARMGTLLFTNSILLLIAVVTMSVARFV